MDDTNHTNPTSQLAVSWARFRDEVRAAMQKANGDISQALGQAAEDMRKQREAHEAQTEGTRTQGCPVHVPIAMVTLDGYETIGTVSLDGQDAHPENLSTAALRRTLIARLGIDPLD